MKLFYGADRDLAKPIYGGGKPSNDYGPGFYMTDDEVIAFLWASQFDNPGYLQAYDLDTSDFRILYLNNNDEQDILTWITLLVKHRFSLKDKNKYKDKIDWLIRHFDINTDGIDMIVGYRADDSYFKYSLDFVANNLSLECLSEAMKLGKLGLQYVIISKKSFNYIKRISSIKVEPSDRYHNFKENTLNEYNNMKKKDKNSNTFIRDLIRKYGE